MRELSYAEFEKEWAKGWPPDRYPPGHRDITESVIVSGMVCPLPRPRSDICSQTGLASLFPTLRRS